MRTPIPEQIEGKALDCFKTIDFPSLQDSARFFEQAKTKLLDINNWHQITGRPSAEFQIMDSFGLPLDRTVERGDYIRIDIPGPGLPSADGYDWVQVESIDKQSEGQNQRLTLTLRPSPDPTNEHTDTAHFFKRLATSSILLEQTGKRIFIHYAGRNEIINTDNSSILDNFRNFMVGLGAKMGASFPQWQALVDGLGNSRTMNSN
ncbi:hypothetical protein [Sphingobacterium paucimobilis]|uniref:Uncharacterized protein n=1 Tax=Sphingobacterium paucimobilis HER1398 TaxID=1346330 RepID=U2H6G5_9SPHI|nr:hypothetical protein [Sphingobacterium paucimobilis]ERJ57296.1 hypothetical protein M472_00810 [Sphingobacterium paucimobilis HER1398]